MLTREKRRTIAGSYPTIFEACVRTIESFAPPSEQQSLLGTKRLLRIQAAQAQAGTITAKLGNTWEVHLEVVEREGRCAVTVQLQAAQRQTDPWGMMYRWIEEFFEALLRLTREMGSQGHGYTD
jgi:hypothetical protein